MPSRAWRPGATPGAILRLVIRTGLRPVAIGGLVGALSAVALARVLDSFLFEIEPRDPSTLVLVA
ncbi:MAG TPA: hypothetical protein VMM93_14910 [Vicinamibacterales bacterium]|nr:hypothetical protein [Vicinamibacterales bacterium]